MPTTLQQESHLIPFFFNLMPHRLSAFSMQSLLSRLAEVQSL
jgi:hypothetical protein